MKKVVIVTGVFLVLVILGIILFSGGESIEIKFESGKMIDARLAKSESEIQKGLMNVRGLGEDNGMIFVFEDEEVRYFWMKNVRFPLDIIFLDKDKKIVNIQTMKTCENKECIQYSSQDKAMYAIEVNEGFAKKNGIRVGQKVSFEL